MIGNDILRVSKGCERVVALFHFFLIDLPVIVPNPNQCDTGESFAPPTMSAFTTGNCHCA